MPKQSELMLVLLKKQVLDFIVKGGLKMINKRLVAGLFVLVALAGIVYAASLIESVQVQSCIDGDNGLNYFQNDSVSGYNIGGGSFSLLDYCASEEKIVEHRCITIVHNATYNTTYRETWTESCYDLGSSGCFNSACALD